MGGFLEEEEGVVDVVFCESIFDWWKGAGGGGVGVGVAIGVRLGRVGGSGIRG